MSWRRFLGGSRQDIERLITWLEHWGNTEDGRPSLHEQAVPALKKLGPDVVPLLIRRLDEELAKKEDAAARRRGHQSDGMLASGLIKAICAIGDPWDPQAVDVFIKALKSHGKALKSHGWQAAKALQRVGTCEKAINPLLDALMKCADSPHQNEASDLIEALLSCGVGPDIVRERLKIASGRYQPEALELLLQLLARLADRGEVHPSAFLEFSKHRHEKVRWQAIEGLKNSLRSIRDGDSDSKYTEELISLTHDKEWSVRWRALRALADLGCGHGVIMEALSECDTPSRFNSFTVETGIILASRSDEAHRTELVETMKQMVATDKDIASGIRRITSTRWPQPVEPAVRRVCSDVLGDVH